MKKIKLKKRKLENPALIIAALYFIFCSFLAIKLWTGTIGLFEELILLFLNFDIYALPFQTGSTGIFMIILWSAIILNTILLYGLVTGVILLIRKFKKH